MEGLNGEISHIRKHSKQNGCSTTKKKLRILNVREQYKRRDQMRSSHYDFYRLHCENVQDAGII
jgi:hypothetical protein